jgi:hypothetical protein
MNNGQNEGDRVRAHSPAKANRAIDRQTEDCVARYANRSPEEIEHRIDALEREWDMERLLEVNASTLAFVGLALGVSHNRKWLIVPGIVLPFLFQHAVQGWCPPIPLFRRLGVRTREEIDREKYALKALRGDFNRINGPHEAVQATR